MAANNALTLQLEPYQAITGQEGRHIDELRSLIKCSQVRSKSLDRADSLTLSAMILARLEQELAFCRATENDDALEIITALSQAIKM